MSKQKRMWTIRGIEGHISTAFHKDGLVAFGLIDLEDQGAVSDVDELAGRIREGHPGHDDGAVASAARGLRMFQKDVQIGDYVVSHDPERDVYCMGVVTSDCERDTRSSDLTNVRRVRWIENVRPDVLSPRTKKTLESVSLIDVLDDDVINDIKQGIPRASISAELKNDLQWIVYMAIDD